MTTNQKITTIATRGYDSYVYCDHYDHHDYSDYFGDMSLPPLVAGTIIAKKFKLLEPLGKGAMGQVWKAEHVAARKRNDEDIPFFAIKFDSDKLLDCLCNMEDVRQLYIKTVGLKHRNICTMYPLEEDCRYGYVLVMEYIPGKTIREYASAKPNAILEPMEAIRILAPIADALDYVHSKGLLHLDIKPDNIMIARDGEPQIIDFGLAIQMQNNRMPNISKKLVRAGSPLYMAPEQWLGVSLDARTDQHALGVVAYELLAGVVPFDYINPFDPFGLEYRVCNTPAPPIPGVNDSVNEVLAKALAKEGKDRFDDCRSFIDALMKAIQI